MTEVEQQAPAPTTEAPAKEEVVEEKKVEAEGENKEEKKDEEKKEESEKDDKNKKEKKEKVKKVKEPKETPPPVPSVHKKDFEKDIVYLYQFPRCPKLPNISPKCLKVETWLKLHGIKYENVNHNSKLRSKRGLLPFVELNGEEICDSELILKSLAKTYNKELDAALNQEQKNIQHAMLTMVDNHLHGAFMYWAARNSDNLLNGYKLNLQQLMGLKLPNACLNFMFKYNYCRKGLAKAKAAGFKGLTPEEVEAEGKKDLQVLKEMLGEQQFFFGEEPHTLDLVAFCHIAQILNIEDKVICPLRDYINEECKSIVDFYERMKERSWGEHWDEAIGDKMELNPHIPKPEPPVEEEKKEEEKNDAEEAADDNKKEDKEKGDKDEKEKEEKKEEDEKKE
jgi:glutathione S-transferase